MARKLKSDKGLFLAMLLLVCVSVVMVYSASAAVALERNRHAILLPHQAGDVGVARPRCCGVVMRIDYRSYQQPFVIWAGARHRRRRAARGALRRARVNGARAGSASAGSASSRRSSPSSPSILFIAALLERRMDRINEPGYVAAADRHRPRRDGRR